MHLLWNQVNVGDATHTAFESKCLFLTQNIVTGVARKKETSEKKRTRCCVCMPGEGLRGGTSMGYRSREGDVRNFIENWTWDWTLLIVGTSLWANAGGVWERNSLGRVGYKIPGHGTPCLILGLARRVSEGNKSCLRKKYSLITLQWRFYTASFPCSQQLVQKQQFPASYSDHTDVILKHDWFFSCLCHQGETQLL